MSFFYRRKENTFTAKRVDVVEAITIGAKERSTVKESKSWCLSCALTTSTGGVAAGGSQSRWPGAKGARVHWRVFRMVGTAATGKMPPPALSKSCGVWWWGERSRRPALAGPKECGDPRRLTQVPAPGTLEVQKRLLRSRACGSRVRTYRGFFRNSKWAWTKSLKIKILVGADPKFGVADWCP